MTSCTWAYVTVQLVWDDGSKIWFNGVKQNQLSFRKSAKRTNMFFNTKLLIPHPTFWSSRCYRLNPYNIQQISSIGTQAWFTDFNQQPCWLDDNLHQILSIHLSESHRSTRSHQGRWGELQLFFARRELYNTDWEAQHDQSCHRRHWRCCTFWHDLESYPLHGLNMNRLREMGKREPKDCFSGLIVQSYIKLQQLAQPTPLCFFLATVTGHPHRCAFAAVKQ